MAGLYDAIGDFFSPEAGQRRTRAMSDAVRRAEYYVPPELRGLLGFAGEMSPVAGLQRAGQASERMFDADRTAGQRVGDLGEMLSETAGVAAPMMVAGRAGVPIANAIQEGLLGFSANADDVGRRVIDRLNQPGPVPTMYSNPVMRPGEINLWHGSPYDFRDFDMGKIGKGEGAQDLGRGFSLTDEQAIAHAYMNPASRWGDLQAMERYRQAGPGRTYQVGVSAAPEQILDWKKPWKSQVKEGTPLYDVIQKRLSTLYTDDPEMQKLYQQADLGSVWRDGLGLEDAAIQSGFVGNKRQNYSGDTEFTVFDPSKMNIKKVFDNEGREISLEGRSLAEGDMRGVLDAFTPGRPAQGLGADAVRPLKFFHGGKEMIQTPRGTIDPEGLLEGFSVTPERGVAEMYANMRGGNAVTEFTVDPNRLRPIDEFDLYDLQNRLELARGLDEGDLADADLLAELRSLGYNAVEYSDPEFGLRVLDPSILSSSASTLQDT